MLLDCLHSVCGDCFTAAVTTHTHLDCPTCRLPSRTHDRLPFRDYVVDHFLAVSDKHKVVRMCAVHDEVNEHGEGSEPATFYCGNCSTFLCSVCTAEHRQHVSFHMHAPVLLEDMTPEMVNLPARCPSHDQPISSFCTTCRVGVCSMCATSDHTTHTIITERLEASYEETCRRLDGELTRPMPHSKVHGMATTLRTLDELLAAGTTNIHAQNLALDDWVHSGTDSVRARAEELRAQMVAQWDVCRKALETQRHDVARRVHALAHAHTYATALRRMGTTLEVLTVGEFVKRRLGALRSWLRPVEPCMSSSLIILTLDSTPLEGAVVAYGGVCGPTIRSWHQGQPPVSEYSDLRIYAMGGCGEDVILATVEQYTPSEDKWETMQRMPLPRDRLSCAVLDNRLYAIGGIGMKGSTDIFDLASRTWNRMCAPMRSPRFCHACATLGGYIYAIGGEARRPGHLSKSVERYDVRTNCWEPRASMVTGRSDFACAVLGEHIYATGGSPNWSDESMASVERYHPVRDCWKPVRDMPVARQNHGAAALEDHLYVIGGSITNTIHTATVDRFDPERDEWRPVAPLAAERCGLAAVTAGDRIYAIGGYTASWQDASDVEAYDATYNVWTICSPMPTPRKELVAAVLQSEDAFVSGL